MNRMLRDPKWPANWFPFFRWARKIDGGLWEKWNLANGYSKVWLPVTRWSTKLTRPFLGCMGTPTREWRGVEIPLD